LHAIKAKYFILRHPNLIEYASARYEEGNVVIQFK
jgi:hypothetical protein